MAKRKDTRQKSEVRKDRRDDDRDRTQDRELTDEQRLDEFRKNMFQSLLPDIPVIPGYHVCWLTTTNPRDSIPARIRQGYEPIRPSELPGWEHAYIRTGEYEGMIGVEEMVAFKLSLPLYEAYMRHNHHELPNQEEGKLVDAMEAVQEEAAQVSGRGIGLDAEEGMEDLREVAPEPPSFEETLAPAHQRY